ncbi:MAG: hypothetical protein VB085_02870 [Peptococcaceae bacterium]|nr:hypothetical protein [Peptococcaceae bacterium]
MSNLTVPGVFPAVVALLLSLLAVKAHNSDKKWDSRGYRLSRNICAIGAVIYGLMAVFQILQSRGIYFR